MLSQILKAILESHPHPVPAVVEAVILEARDGGVSDIHFEPNREGLRVRFRLDGVLQDAAEIPDPVQEKVIGRLKVLADLPTYRIDVPQEGHVKAETAPGGADLRVSIFPTLRGEKAVVRLFRIQKQLLYLQDLGLPEDLFSALQDLTLMPEGLLLLTGPAGAGKTTTNYALLREILRQSGGRKHIVTVEDPVEIEMEGITQTQVNPDIELTFQRCLRSLLRQDPEVIFIGEIRDPETAQIAVEAALTGHKVLSTVHAGSTHGVFHRLLEMGIEPYLLGSAAPAVLNQRLLRVLCPQCKVEDGPGGAYRPVGCDACLGTGYQGRRLIADLLVPNKAFNKAVLSKADEETLEGVSGCVGLRRRAEALVSSGSTDGGEVDRVLGSPRQSRERE
ncbi:MAG: GspE/PulE family protein [Planctomycetota bacterium]|jgi:type II secretory ATPase GspE/PulE/Tfp pilus assembly ATPase PilB-like protein